MSCAAPRLGSSGGTQVGHLRCRPAAVLLGLVCLGTGVVRSSLSTMLAGVVLLVCAARRWNVAEAGGIVTDVSLTGDIEAARAGEHTR